jgi:predicted Zn-dependent protease
LRKDDHTFVFHGVTASTDYAAQKATLVGVMDGFARVTDPGVLNKQPVRLRIERAPSSGTARAVLRALGAPEDKIDELALINGKKADDRVEKGTWMKLVRE